MPLADAGAYLPRDAIHRLRRRSNVRGAWLVLHAWGVIALAMAAFAWWPNPLTLVAGVVIVGGRQQRRRLQLRDALGSPTWPWPRRLARAAERIGPGVLVNVVLGAGLGALGYWYLYVALWLVPMATWYQLISRIRNIAEHAVVPDDDDPLRNTRTTYAGWLERAVIAPYFVNYHLEHHLLLFVPCWRLPAAHRALLEGGFGSRMEIQPGYRAMLRVATGAASDRGRPDPAPGGAQHI